MMHSQHHGGHLGHVGSPLSHQHHPHHLTGASPSPVSVSSTREEGTRKKSERGLQSTSALHYPSYAATAGAAVSAPHTPTKPLKPARPPKPLRRVEIVYAKLGYANEGRIRILMRLIFRHHLESRTLTLVSTTRQSLVDLRTTRRTATVTRLCKCSTSRLTSALEFVTISARR